MAVIYVFDTDKRRKRVVKEGIQELIHSEGNYQAVAEMRSQDAPENGEYIGFKCVDGRHRLFLVRIRDRNDETGLTTITATDAALAELDGMVVEALALTDTTAQEAAQNVLSGTGWTLGTLTADGEVKIEDAYFETAWAVLKRIGAAGKVRVVPYYEFSDGEIVGRKVDLTDKTPVFRGLIHTRKKGTRNIRITEEGAPKGRVYPVGKITGTTDPPERVTIADAVWSTANGDPVDKPAGQTWISLPGSTNTAGFIYSDQQETDAAKLMEEGYQALLDQQNPKATGSALISDMEFIPGYEHRVVRLWDLAVIRTEDGETVETTVINIDRYYIHRELTKITVGEEDDETPEDITEQLAKLENLAGITARRVGGASNAAAQNKQLILNAEELIQLNAKRIELNAEEIALKASIIEVEELADETLVKFNDVSIELDAAKAEIAMKANQTTVDNLDNIVDEMSAELIVQAGQISTKVSHNGVISAINQTAEEILIQANRINLSGYVTASQLSAEMAEIDKIFSGYTQIDNLSVQYGINAQSAQFTNVSLINYDCMWSDVTMGSVAKGMLLATKTTGDLDLQHSHAVTVGTDGKITLGEVSSSGGSFNIADTKIYKDAVSAAYEEGKAAAGENITLSSAGWVNGQNVVTASNGQTYTVRLPSFTSSASSWSSNKLTVYFYTDSVTGPLKSHVVDASSIYNNGYSAGDSAGYNRGYAAVTLSQGSWNTTTYKKRVTASNSKYVTVDATEIYNKGYNYGYNVGYNEGKYG